MENFVSNLRSFAMDTYRTSIEAVNTLELGVVPFISRHFALPADVDTFRTTLAGEDHPLEAELSLTLGPSRLEEDYSFQQELSIFKASEPEDSTVATVHLFEQQEVQVIASPGAPFSELRQSLKSGALEDGESTPHSPKDILVETSPISLRRAVKDGDALGSLPDLEADCQRITSILDLVEICYKKRS